MGIKIGNIDASYFKVGGDDCSIYLGNTLLYPTTPSFDGKYKLILTDDSVVSGECDSSSELTRSEVSAYTTTLKEAVVGDCITSIGQNAFSGCTSLTSCTIGSGVTSIRKNTFYGCTSLASITIPNSVTSIGVQAFYQCSGLTSCTFGSGVTSIGNYAFRNCSSITSIVIPNSVTSIGIAAFYQCTSLTSCTIGSGVTSIYGEAFNGCTSLTSVTVEAATPPTLGSMAFNNTNNCPIYVPSGSVEAYKTASIWSNYASRIQAIPNS